MKQVEGEAGFADRRPEAVTAPALSVEWRRRLRPSGPAPGDQTVVHIGQLLDRFGQGTEPHPQIVGRQPSRVP